MSNLEVIEQLYIAFREKNYESFRALCAPDVAWIQNEGFPEGGTYHGADEIIDRVFRAFGDEWETWTFETGEFIEARNAVIVIGSYTGRHRRSGKAFRATAAHVYELAHGQVTRFRQFADTKMIWDATK